MASARVCSAVRDPARFSGHDHHHHNLDHLAFAQHSRSERQLLRELDRAFTEAEEQVAASASSSSSAASSSWKSYPQRRKAEMRRAVRRNSVGSVTSVGSVGTAESAESRGLDNEGEWINFLSGLDGAIQRAAAPPVPSSPTRKQTQSQQTKSKQTHQRRRRASLGRSKAASSSNDITDAIDFSSSLSASPSCASSSSSSQRQTNTNGGNAEKAIYPDSRPKSALRKGKFHSGERLFVDAFLSRSSGSSRRQTANFGDATACGEQGPPERLRFDTPTVYHLSHEGALERTEVSWTAVDHESSASFISLPKIRTSATTYSRMKRRQMQQMMMFQEQMQMKHRRVPVRRNSLSLVAPVVADFRQ